MPFVYDPKLRGSGYRDTATGRLIPYRVVRQQIGAMLQASQDVQRPLAEMVANGTISPDSWNQAVRQEIKDNYITQYLLGKGGRENMTQADWGSTGGMIADQYRYLEGFYAEVAAEQLTEGQIYARAQMYINSSREAYETALRREVPNRGYTSHRWVLSAVENCDDCIVLAGEGWKDVAVPFVSPSTGVETVPGSGDTLCLTNCKCNIEYR